MQCRLLVIQTFPHSLYVMSPHNILTTLCLANVKCVQEPQRPKSLEWSGVFYFPEITPRNDDDKANILCTKEVAAILFTLFFNYHETNPIWPKFMAPKLRGAPET